MFNDVNKLILIGNLTADPELKRTPSGTPVTQFSVVTNHRYKKDEEWVDQANFHNVVVWRNAENIAKWAKKGTKIHLEGRVQTRNWEKDGVKHYRTEVIANEVNLLTRFRSKDEMASSPTQQVEDNSPVGPSEPSIDPDELPF
jgi:single-strand DNA-binding protein